ncbi:MAG: PilX N-terminal domain-containing pilus assembly protein [Firmicutes bacterium]|nr:PilX N-terminal domain-containing pilus assembly protein [Bacillota bacterium]
MSNRRGTALVWLLFAVLLFSLLGTSLFQLAMSDLRVSGHLVAAEEAQYAAEAGIELAVSVLPWLYSELGEDEWQVEHFAAPTFVVTAKREDSGLVRIHAQGHAGAMTKDVEVLASLRPFGRQALVGQRTWLTGVNVVGHVCTDEIVFDQLQSHISGDLRTLWLELLAGGSYLCEGHLCGNGRPYELEVDFVHLAEEAWLCGWQEPDLVDDVYQVDGRQPGPLYAKGTVEINLQEPWQGLLIAEEDVSIDTWVDESQLVILAKGDVFLGGVDEMWQGSLFVYSGGTIYRTVAGCLELSGCLVAPALELAGVTITYGDEAILAQLEVLPVELLKVAPTFDLEWLELAPRR